MKKYFLSLYLLVFLCFYVWISRISLFRVGVFGCFDDCFNFVAAHFMLQGKELYSDIFFNHQPFAASISYVIQKIGHPMSLYQLVMYHRIFIILIGCIFDIYFIFRYRAKGFLFAVLYEGTKYYIFGNRFLAESLVVYLVVFMVFSIIENIETHKQARYSYIIFPILSYCIFFLREPFIPLGLFLYGVYFFLEKSWKKRAMSFFLLSIFSGITLLILPFSSYWFCVITVNMTIEIQQQAFSLIDIAKIIIYPVFVLFQRPFHHFTVILWVLSLFWIGSMGYCLARKKWKYFLFIMTALALSNIRTIPVGTVYFNAFHIIVWFAILLVSITCIVFNNQNKGFRLCVYGLFFCCALFSVFGKGSFVYEKTNTREEFNNSYAHYFVNGEVIRLLSNPGDTLYVEMWDDLVYVQAKLPSSYRYSWYTSVMPLFPIYVKARERMWRENPSDFYFGNCAGNNIESILMPENMKSKYTQLLFAHKPSCVYVKNDRISKIKSEQWQAIKRYEYTLPEGSH